MSLDAELQALAGRVRPFDPAAAERLEDLGLAVSPGGDLSNWSGVDLFQAIDPEGIAAGLRGAAAADERLARWERLRNTLALAPLLLTWAGLSIAAAGYRAAVQADPTLLAQPFLLLWEEGFAGYLPPPLAVLTFSHVALGDILLLAAMLFLTWRLHGELHVSRVRREAEARALAAELRHACWRAALVLASRSSPLAMLQQFRQASEALLDELSAERTRLEQIGAEREREIADLQSFARDLRQGAGDLLRQSGEVKPILDGLHQLSAALDGHLDQLTRQQARLEASIEAVGRKLAAQSQTQQAATAGLEATAGLLCDAADVAAAATAGVSDGLLQLKLELAELRAAIGGPLAAVGQEAGNGSPSLFDTNVAGDLAVPVRLTRDAS